MSWADQWERKVKDAKFASVDAKAAEEHAARVEKHKLKRAEKAATAAGKRPRKKALAPGETPMDERIEVPKDKVGLLIGAKGENIRQLQSKSGAHIRVLKEGDLGVPIDDDDVRIVRISGTSSQVNQAKRDILNLFDSTDVKKTIQSIESVWKRSRSRSPKKGSHKKSSGPKKHHKRRKRNSDSSESESSSRSRSKSSSRSSSSSKSKSKSKSKSRSPSRSRSKSKSKK